MGAETRMRASWFRQYKAMIWKNYLLKRRNLKYTIYEFVLPLYMVAILAIVRATSVQDAKPPMPMFPEYSLSSPVWTGPGSNSSMRVLVTPDNDYTKAIMNDVMALSPMTVEPEYYPTDTDAEAAFSNNASSVFGGVSFNYSGNGDLSYAIRMNDNNVASTDGNDIFHNQAACRNDDNGLSNNCDVLKYLRSSFSLFQTMIDTAIIRNKTGNTGFPLSNTSVQMLPKPAYLQDTSYIQTLSSIYFVLAFTPLINIMTVLIVTEKEKKIKEGMKMMGLRSSVFWFSWSTVYLVIITAVSVAITIIAVVAKFFQNSNMFLFFIMIWLYGLSIMSISFLVTPFFNKAQTAGGLATMATMLTSLLYLIVSQTRTYEEGTGSASYDVPVYGRWLLCILSPTALSLGIDQAVYLDVRGGMTFESVSHGEFPLYGPILMLALDTLFYFLLAMYLDQVIPGEYGPRYKPLFLCTKDFWFPPEKEANQSGFANHIYEETVDGEMEESINPDIEAVPQSMKAKAAVRIQKLSKIFKKKKKDEEDVKAVNELTLTIYEDQITAILGHNGAGKTTLINILTGMTGPTSGSATIFGLDVSDTNEMSTLREMTGICPQHNILFDPLTCAEHLRLFAGLKGVPEDQVEEEVQTALASVDLKDKANEMSQTLSGGQKRKLSVAIAIIGDPKIIILDEPTAGMDPYSRRHLWSVLKEKKKGRIILLTTHFMDEADILADRKAMVNKGSLRSCGSSLFLKNRFGLGYHLNMVVEPTCDTERVCQMVSSIVAGSEINRIHGKELDITMPHDGVTNFSGLFKELEQESTLKTYGIKSYGVSMTTLEEVFLKLEEDLENIELTEGVEDSPSKKLEDRRLLHPPAATEVDIHTINGINPSDTVKCLEGMDLTLQRYRALCFIRMVQTYRRGVTLFWKFFVPVGLLIGGLILSKNLTKSEQDKTLAKTKPILITPSYYTSMVSGGESFPYGTIPKFLMHDEANNVDSQAYVANISSTYQTTTYLDTYTNDSLLLLDKGVAPHYMGMEIEDFTTTAARLTDLKYKVWFNDSAIHSVPACINLINNFLLKTEAAAAGIPNSNDSLSVSSFPWPSSGRDEFQWNNAAFLAVLLIGMAFSYIPGAFGPNVVADRECKARSQLRVSGVSFAMYWSTYFTVDFVVFLIPAVMCIICIFAIGVDAFQPAGAAASVVLLCLCYIPSNIMFSYFFSFMFDKMETAEGVMPGFYGLLGYMPYFPVSIVDMIASTNAATVMHTIFCILFPPYNLFGGLYYINKIYTEHMWTFTVDQIKSSEYFDFESNIPTAYICSLLHLVIFFFLLRLLDIYKTGGDIRETCFLKGEPNLVEPSTQTGPAGKNEDEDVTTERMRVKGLQRGVIGKEFPVAIAEELRKEFKKAGSNGGGCKKPKEDKVKVAVHDTTFAVDAGEVFGLLGPNGAGKTTTLNMMTADVGPDRGKVIVGGYDINSSMSDAFQAMGYCPQHDALWTTITLKEHLDCYTKIRGIPPENHFEVTNYFMENLKLDEHKDKHAKKLSGGTKRKMSYGMSMLGRPKIVLLDEPSTGMDPQSKRFLWDTISGSFQNSERGAILTTHYMEEADALCSRIAIMVNGKIECIGSSQHLKNKYGSGYLLEIKIKQEEDGTLLKQKMDRLKTFVMNLFSDASVMEQFSERVQYKVPKSNVTSLAKVFSELEEGKTTLDIAEYSFSQSTLEQVFLEFAKMQMDEGETDETDDVTRKKSLLRSMSQQDETGPERL